MLNKILFMFLIILLISGCGSVEPSKYTRSKTIVFKAKQLEAEGLKAVKYGDGKSFLIKIWDDINLFIMPSGYANVDKEKVYDYYVTLKKGDNLDPKKDLGFLRVLNGVPHGPSADGVSAWHYDENVEGLYFQNTVNGKREERRNIEFEKYNMAINVKNYELEKVERANKRDGEKPYLAFFKRIEMEITVNELR